MFQNIPLTKIKPNPDQPRDFFTGIEALAESIKTEGLLEPIMVRPKGEGFQIIHGERRYRAAKLAGLTEVPAIVREVDDATMFRLSVVENVQRSNLTPVEEASAYRKMQDEHGMTQAEIGRSIGKGQSYVAHKLRLLTVPDVLTFYVARSLLSENHFRQAMRFKKIIGEDARESFTLVESGKPRDLKATVISLIQLRPYGRTDTALPHRPRSRANIVAEDAVIEAVNRFFDYVSKHNPIPVWERVAFWYLSAAVGYGWTVAEMANYVSDFENLIYSQVYWYTRVMRLRDRDGEADWDSYEWAVYHDLKHAGLLQSATRESDLARRATQHLARRDSGEINSVVRPTEQQGSEPSWAMPDEDQKPLSEKTLEELEDDLCRSLDKSIGGAVGQAESITALHRFEDHWRERGANSFGEYVEERYGLPAEVVMRPDGEIRHTAEMARMLDEWSSDIFLGRLLASMAGSSEAAVWEFLEDTDEDEHKIPPSAVWNESGEPYSAPEIARNLYALEGKVA